MRLPSLLFRPVLSYHISPKLSPPVHSLRSSSSSISLQSSIVDEVLAILDTINPIEAALNPLVPFLSSQLVNSIIRKSGNPQLGFRFFIWASKWKRLRSRATRELIIDMLLKRNGFDLYWQTLEELKAGDVSIASDAFYVLISRYADVGDFEKALEIFGKMKEFDCQPDVHTYNKIIHVASLQKTILLALTVYNQMLKFSCMPSVSTYSILIDGLCKSGKNKEALTLFDEMTERGILPNRFTYTIVISGLCQAERFDDAYRLFKKMKESGCSPDFVAYNALLNGFCKLGRVDETFALLRTFQRDGFVIGLHGYTSLIDGLFRAKRHNEAFAWYRKMLEEGVEPDVVLYAVMIRGLSEVGKIRDARKLMAEMGEKGVVPNTYCYNALIKGLCDIGVLDQARSLHLQILKRDSVPTTWTYSILICGMCRNGLVDDAEKIFNEMEKAGCLPSVFTFNALIDGLCKAGELEKANFLFYKMEIGRNPLLFLQLSQGDNRVLDSASLKTMVEKFCQSGLILKAYKILRQLEDSGNVPDIITYNILINGFCKAGNINGAFNLFKELQLKGLCPNSVTYGTLIRGLQGVGREEDAFRIFDQMVKDGCTPSVAVYRSLMSWSCRRRKVSLAFSLWLKYLREISGREDKTLRAIGEHFEKGEVEKAVQGLLETDFKLNDFSSAPYTIFLIGMCQAGKVEEGLKIFYMLEESEVIITPPSCVKLINGLCKRQNLDQAIDIFLYTLRNGFMLRRRICNNLLRSLLRSEDKRNVAYDILWRMKSLGYDLDAYLNQTTKSLLAVHPYSRRMDATTRIS